MARVLVKVRDDQDQGVDYIQHEDLFLASSFLDYVADLDGQLKSSKNIKYREGDIMLCSYPKTGTHWSTQLINCMLTPGPVQDIPSINPFILEFYPPEKVESYKSPRILVSHLKCNRLPRDHIQKKEKTVFILRNPKDTAVSLYHHCRRLSLMNNNQSWGSFVTSFLAGFVPWGSYFDYLSSWQAAIEDNKEMDLLIVYYEDLKKNCLSELRRINDYLAADNTDARLQEIMDRCSIKILRSDVDSGKVKTVLVNNEGESVIYRKGEIGDWKNHFTVAESELFDRISRDKLRHSMFHFQYE